MRLHLWTSSAAGPAALEPRSRGWSRSWHADAMVIQAVLAPEAVDALLKRLAVERAATVQV